MSEIGHIGTHKHPVLQKNFTMMFIVCVLLIVSGCVQQDSVESQETFVNSIGIEFVQIPAGEFNMGSSENYQNKTGKDDERPLHHVVLSKSFYMGKYEVTQKQWREVMGTEPSLYKGDDLPVDQVSWGDVHEFIKKLNEKEGTNKYRLPSEAEWEYSARAGTTTKYSFGDDEFKLNDYAWYFGNSGPLGLFILGPKTHPVGHRKPNAWGLYDMYGNAWEWVQDKYHSNYSGAPADGSAWESGSSSNRIARGGGFLTYPIGCRSAYRGPDFPSDRTGGLGFRLLRDL
ncbi:Hercynine oxygenase [uncultured archaeon]|nr:Hercynine oxygenase [uncultured archaeon]